MVDEIKKNLRIMNNEYDTEIINLIEACKMDLKLSGINKIIETDYLIKKIICIYCKANFGIDNSDSEKYAESYKMLKIHLAISQEYSKGV